MVNNPYAGRVPLNRVSDLNKAQKATSYRPGKTHKPDYRCQYHDDEVMQRNPGCEALRRYPNGALDYRYALDKVLEVIHKVRDNGNLTPYEKSILAMLAPGGFSKIIDTKIAQTMTKLSLDERMILGAMLRQHMQEELNWNAGGGGGSTPGRSVTVV
jgi:hypothetical protein